MTDQSLESIELFRDLPEDARETLESKCRWRQCGPGEHVINRGDELNDVNVIVSGRAQVVNYSEAGKAVDYATLGEGDVFGELAAIDGLPRSAWVITKSNCIIATLPGKAFIDIMTSHPAAALALLRRLSRIIRAANDRISDFSLLDAEQRVCLEVLRMAKPLPDQSGGLIIAEVPTQSDIGNGVGLARETVGRIMAGLKQRKIIERKGRTLYIKDADSLHDLAMI